MTMLKHYEQKGRCMNQRQTPTEQHNEQQNSVLQAVREQDRVVEHRELAVRSVWGKRGARMSDRSQTGHTNTGGPQSYASEVAYFIDNFSKREVRDRIDGLFEEQLYAWIKNCESTDVANELSKKSKTMSLERDNWAWSLTHANTKTFETFVDNEHRKEWLNSIIEAEIERTNTRGERIGYVNQRKQELS